LVRGQIGGCSAADEEGLDRPVLVKRGEFGRQGIQVKLDQVVLARRDGKIAVAAVVSAKRDVNVSSPGL
jgi:hypothetical protein